MSLEVLRRELPDTLRAIAGRVKNNGALVEANNLRWIADSVESGNYEAIMDSRSGHKSASGCEASQTTEFYFSVRLDAEVPADQPESMTRERLQAELSRAAQEIAPFRFCVGWSPAMGKTEPKSAPSGLNQFWLPGRFGTLQVVVYCLWLVLLGVLIAKGLKP